MKDGDWACRPDTKRKDDVVVHDVMWIIGVPKLVLKNHRGLMR